MAALVMGVTVTTVMEDVLVDAAVDVIKCNHLSAHYQYRIHNPN